MLGLRAKLGLQRGGDDAADESLAADWLALLHAHGVDFNATPPDANALALELVYVLAYVTAALCAAGVIFERRDLQ